MIPKNRLSFRCLAVTAFVLYAISTLGLFPVNAASPAADDLVIAITSGQLRGAPRSTGGGEFLGIPYAQPPVGDLRWREPAPAKSWNGVRDASTFGAPCAQPDLGGWNRHDAETGVEDCLFLNVITPVWPPKAPLPVMVWLHGGANAGGTASSTLYKDGTLVGHGVVLVTVNYRLGIFGFFAHPELTRESSHHASGNYGLMDQIAALHWVRDNIAKFGGDPANITLFGQSAGAGDASLLMTSPLAKDLFQRVIGESGSAVSPPLPSLAEAEQAGQRQARALKAPAAEGTPQYLRQLSQADLIKGLVSPDPTQPPPLGPILDGWVMARFPQEVFAAEQESSIPLMIGTTTREFGLPVPSAEVRRIILNRAGNFADRTLALYGLAGDGQGAADPMYGSAGDQWLADVAFRCPVTTQAAWHAAAHHPTYEYEFERVIPGHEAEGAVHSSDLPYVFGYYPKTGNIAGAFSDVDFKLADTMETYWTNFAKTGDPNGGTLPNWPAFGDSQAFLQFTPDGQVAKSAGLRRAQCDLYRDFVKQRMRQ